MFPCSVQIQLTYFMLLLKYEDILFIWKQIFVGNVTGYVTFVLALWSEEKLRRMTPDFFAGILTSRTYQ